MVAETARNRKPGDREIFLAPETIKFLSELRAQDIKELRDAVAVYHATKSAASIVRWIVYGLIVTFMAAVSMSSTFGTIKTFVAGWLTGK